MAKAGANANKGPAATTVYVCKAVDISFDQLRDMVSEAIETAYPMPPEPGCSYPPSLWVRAMYDDRAVFSRDGKIWQVGYSYANGAAQITSAPVQVVQTYAPIAATSPPGAAAAAPPAPPAPVTATAKGTNMSGTTTKTRKDNEGSPGAAAPEGGAGDGEGVIGDGADIVMLALERLQDIVDAIESGGGALTPDLAQSVDGVCALLETVTPEGADDMDDGAEDGLAAGPGSPEPMSASAKAAYGTEKEKTEKVAKKVKAEKRWIATVAYALAKRAEEKDEKKVAKLDAWIEKALLYGAEAYGSETGFASANAGEKVPEFKDPSQETTTDTTEDPTKITAGAGGQYAENPTYSGANANTGGTAGSPEFVEKIANLRKRLGTPVNKGAAAAPPASTTTTVEKNHHPGVEFTPAYVQLLPDSAFLYVEPGPINKDLAGRSNLLTQGPATAFRHFPVRDVGGALHGAAIRKAIGEIPHLGVEAAVKSELMKQAQALLKEAEALEASKLTKSDRGDTGWPDDMNDERFKNGQPKLVPSFGFDNIATKAKAGPVPARR